MNVHKHVKQVETINCYPLIQNEVVGPTRPGQHDSHPSLPHSVGSQRMPKPDGIHSPSIKFWVFLGSPSMGTTPENFQTEEGGILIK